MAQPIYKHLDGQNVAQLQNFKLNPVASDPTTPVVGVPWYNTTTNKLKFYDGTAIRVIANLGDLAALGRYRGQWDASIGIPTAAASTVLPGDPIKAGDHWRVSVGGNINNLIGVDLLAPGDLLFADADGANAAAQFYAVQANADLSTGLIGGKVHIPAGIPANTSPTVVPTFLAGGKIFSYMILMNGNLDITNDIEVQVDQSVPKLTITTIADTGYLDVYFTGIAV